MTPSPLIILPRITKPSSGLTLCRGVYYLTYAQELDGVRTHHMKSLSTPRLEVARSYRDQWHAVARVAGAVTAAPHGWGKRGTGIKVSRNNTSGYRNVTWSAKLQHWIAKVIKDGVAHQASFDTIEEADAHATKLRRELHGEKS